MSSVWDELFVKAVKALGSWSMLAHPFHRSFLVFLIDLSTVKTSPAWPMVAFRFGIIRFLILCSSLWLWLLRLFCLVTGAHAVETLSTGRMVAFGCDIAGPNVTYYLLYVGGTDAMALLFLSFWISSAGLENSSIAQIWNLVDFLSFRNGESFIIFSLQDEILNRIVTSTCHLYKGKLIPAS